MTPIEPGCLCVILGSDFSENIGRQVRAIYLERRTIEGDIWMIESFEPLVGVSKAGRRKYSRKFLSWGHDLLRIDGYESVIAEKDQEMPV
ncbi:hypothetical protein MRB56_12805 [Halomonas cupida]|uniref:hypothetical protein n=1 Tax=Halomonas cupida TaxID=44933 RepID=UPI0039B63F36